MTRPIIQISGGICKMPRWRMRKPVDFTLFDDEHMAIVGRNGSGKSMLVDILTGRHPLLADQIAYDFSDCNSPLASDNIRYIAFRDTYGGDNDRTYFLQQRWNQMEIDAETPTAGEKLEEAFLLAGSDSPERRRQQQRLYDRFGMQQLLDKKMILLSSGELRKLVLVKKLARGARVVVLDEPYIGLDIKARQELTAFLTLMSKHTTFILLLADTVNIPPFITHVATIVDKCVVSLVPYLRKQKSQPTPLKKLSSKQIDTGEEVVRLNNVSVSYFGHMVLPPVTWHINRGERWVLTGRNGAGKSTLLSLICATRSRWQHLGNEASHRLRFARDAS